MANWDQKFKVEYDYARGKLALGEKKLETNVHNNEQGTRLKLYDAFVCGDGANSVATRVSVYASTAFEAKSKLEAEYGKGQVFDVHNKADAAQPR